MEPMKEPLLEIPEFLKIEKKRFLRAYMRNPGNITAAASRAGVPRRTVYRWIEDDPYFRESFENAGAMMQDFVESKLLEHIKRGSLRAIKFYLTTRAKDCGF